MKTEEKIYFVNNLPDTLNKEGLTFLSDYRLIKIPVKVKYVLDNYISAKELLNINKNIVTAKEYCLLFLSYFTAQQFKEDETINLNSTILRNNFGNSYVKIIKLLMKGSKKGGAIIEQVGGFKIGYHSYGYKLTDNYYKKGFVIYEIQTESILNKLKENFKEKILSATSNTIARSLLNNYPYIQLPTDEEILEEGRRLAKKKVKTTKGKIITWKGTHSKDYWIDSSNRSFVEDSIELFNYLTKTGFLVPIVGDYKSGGRVVDSFTLLPKWIRKMIRIKSMSEVIYDKGISLDYSALHPNIANALYDGSGNTITHTDVANYLGIERREAKIEHLSFFNKNITQMQKSPLWRHYIDKETVMLNNIIKEKETVGYKETSYNLFKTEVSIMTDVVEEFNKNGIRFIYVYDEMIVAESDKELGVRIMDRVITKHGVNTFVNK